MKVITNNRRFENLLVKLISKHDEVCISVAWASAKTGAYKLLLDQRDKLRITTIGTHFYQTDPDVLDSFIDSENVRFITQPDGVFHPKVYFFSSADGWDAIVGSANMTAGAMRKNEEMSVHMTGADDLDGSLKRDILRNIERYYASASPISREDADSYRLIWAKQKRNLDRVAGKYGGAGRGKPAIQSQIMRMGWDEFMDTVQKDKHHDFRERLELLDFITDAFDSHDKYRLMEKGLRKTIAGLPNDTHPHWPWFGSMKGAGVFHSLINNNSPKISEALNHISSDQTVTKSCYMRFVTSFTQAFLNGRDGVATASRLLAMKRPDVFVCIDSKNRKRMCADFGIKVTGMTYERYWDELICRIQDSVWWQTDTPEKEGEKHIWKYRVALLDCIFYDEEEAAK